MHGIISQLMQLFRRIGLTVLALNIMLVSIPRCDMIFSVWQQHLTVQTADAHVSCHDSGTPVDSNTQVWTQKRFCECALLQFMAFHVPALDLQSHLIFRVHSERLLLFDWQALIADFMPRIDPPYPKA